MSTGVAATLFAIFLFLGMLLFLEFGRRIGTRLLVDDPEGARTGTAVIDGAVFGLLGLLIAFTFSGAASRFDTRRQLIVQETNAISTAYLRLDVLPAANQATLRDAFRRYVDSRLEIYRKLPDLDSAMAELSRSNDLQGEIWTGVVTACRSADAPSYAAMLLLPALNEMIDITTTRTLAARMHQPLIIFITLALIALASAMLAGYGMASRGGRNWFYTFGFATIMAFSVYVIVDLEFPRIGLIRVDTFDQALVDLRATMK